MPTDVSGTINIIAEVVGRNQTATNDANDVLEGKNKQAKNKNRKNILGVALEMKTLVKILTIGGLASQSKTASQSMGTIFRMLGFLVDVILMPLVPFFVRGLTVMGNILTFVQNFQWPSSMGEVWESLKDWWQNQWEEKGGLTGIIKEFFLDVTGVILLTSLLATFTLGPRAGLWILQNTFGRGAMLTKDFIGKLLGWTKKTATVLLQTVRTIGNYATHALLNAPGLMKRMFVKSALFTKSMLAKAFGLVKFLPGGTKATKAATLASKYLWKAALFGTMILGSLWTAVGSIFGALGISSALGAMGGALLPFLFSLLFVGAVVSGIWVLNYILKKVFNKTLDEIIADTWMMKGLEDTPATDLGFWMNPGRYITNELFPEIGQGFRQLGNLTGNREDP